MNRLVFGFHKRLYLRSISQSKPSLQLFFPSKMHLLAVFVVIEINLRYNRVIPFFKVYFSQFNIGNRFKNTFFSCGSFLMHCKAEEIAVLYRDRYSYVLLGDINDRLLLLLT